MVFHKIMIKWLRFCTYNVHNKYLDSSNNLYRNIIYYNYSTSKINEEKGDGKSNEEKIHADSYKKLPTTFSRDPFLSISKKTKDAYLSMVETFIERNVHRRNHVEFIYAALKHMAEFNVQHDLQVYKALINVMPKGVFIPQNLFQVEFMHYPKQQQCIIDLLEQMEDFKVMPDYEMEAMLINVFGRYGHPLRKYWRMMYWMPKFKNLSPWSLPYPMPDDTLTLAKLAVERMCTVDVRSEISVFETSQIKEAIDYTWIVSGQSPDQIQLLVEHPHNAPLYIEGPFLIWLRNKTINYFTLRADPHVRTTETISGCVEQEEVDDVTNLKIPIFGQLPSEPKKHLKKLKSVHQQNDGTIFAICATGTSTKDSLLSWIRLLESHGNPTLNSIPVLFRFRSNVKDVPKQIETTFSSDSVSQS